MTSSLQVLHICSDFAKQRVYRELVAHLEGLGVGQFIYVPVRSAAEIDVNRQDDLERVQYRYSHVLRPWHRLLFRCKIRRVVQDLLEAVDPARFDLVHAHFLYSDGGAALTLAQRFGLPYLVAVRNTDVNVFMRYRPDLRWRCWDVVQQAEYLVFITPKYLDLLLSRAPASIRQSVIDKARVIPNGLSKFWIDAIDHAPRARAESVLRLLYVGDLSRNKNVIASMEATRLLNEQRAATLTVVGGGGDGESAVDSLLATGRYPFVTRAGRVEDPAKLLAIYREHDVFVMPSFRETFGVAYIEALSQGLPIVFARGQGVDGYFEPHTVGEAVDPAEVSSIRDAVLAIADRLAAVRPRCSAAAQSFAWPGIAQRYVDLYRAISAKTGSVVGR